MPPRASGLTRSRSSPAYVVVFGIRRTSTHDKHCTTDRKAVLQARSESFEDFVAVELERLVALAATVRVGLPPWTFPASRTFITV